MSKGQPALIETQARSNWGSCLTIMPNLAAAYRMGREGEIATFNYSIGDSPAQILSCAQDIFEAQPSHLIFIDHQKHPIDLLIALDLCYKSKKWPKLIFHVYGDFTLATFEWKKIENLLRGKQVLFVCASERQRAMVSSFIGGGNFCTDVCPFPVSEDEYFFSTGIREKFRKDHDVKPEELLLVYTGRLSLQKNILRMIHDVSDSCQKSEIPFRFLLAGSFDDMGSPFFGFQSWPGAYHHAFEDCLNSLPQDVRNRVTYIGAKEKSDLFELYHGADVFVSFSTHHDEDYGMSPIEALCCGARALMSDWGGFAGFQFDDESVRLLPTSIGSYGPEVDTRRLPQVITDVYEKCLAETMEDRRSRGTCFGAAFGIEAASIIVSDFQSRQMNRFDSFSPELKRHAVLREGMLTKGYMFKMGKTMDPNYVKFYRHYCTGENAYEKQQSRTT